MGVSTHDQPHPACSDGGGRAESLHSARSGLCRCRLGTLAPTWPGRPSVRPPGAYEPRWNGRDHHALPADGAGPNTQSRGGGWASVRKEEPLGGRPPTPGLPAQAVSPDSGAQLRLRPWAGGRCLDCPPSCLPALPAGWLPGFGSWHPRCFTQNGHRRVLQVGSEQRACARREGLHQRALGERARAWVPRPDPCRKRAHVLGLALGSLA